MSQETEIIVWGPTQSGKDWLYRGFAKELEEYTLRSNDFIFELREMHKGSGNFTPVTTDPPDDITPTAIGEDYIHSFTRKIKQDKKTDANKTSVYTHYFNFHNNRGSDLVAALEDPTRFDTTFSDITGSQYILIVLDPNFDKLENLSLVGTPDIGYSERALQPGMSKDNYFKVLTMLFNSLIEHNTPKKHLAVCITKTDTLRISNRDPWDLLARAFGQKIYRLFDNYRKDFNMEAFATSAAGYATIRGKPEPNYSKGKLIDADHWRPTNCAAPFFWIFQNKEIEQIKLNSNFLNKESNLRNYKRYPILFRNI